MIVSGVPALPYDDSAGFTAPPAFGPFRVLHQIGSGALGPVFRAVDSERERLVAVKVIRLDIVPEAAAQVADALQRIASTPVSSPYALRVVGAGLERMTPFLACEFAAADTFDVVLRRVAPATPDRALALLRPMAEAIEAAWQAGLGHGALHPRDVFVTVEAGEVSVAGFGVVQALDRLGIRTPMRRPYTAPERLVGHAWDMRADVYSFGVLAHELLTGRRPSATAEQEGTLAPVLRRALAGALAEDPGRRYATPSAFIDALETGEAPAHSPAPAPAPAPVPAPASVPAAPAPRTAPAPVVVAEVDRPAAPPVPGPASRPVSSPARAARPAGHDVLLIPPPPTPMTSGAVIALVAAALVVGTGVGLWWSGASVTPVDSIETRTVPEDGPGDAGAPVVAIPATRPPVAEPVQEAAPAPAAPARSTRGRLIVRSEPTGARVLVAGRSRGTTPASLRDLPFGRYNITVSHQGYQTKIERVNLTRAMPTRDITVTLKPAVQAAPGVRTGAVYIETRPAGAQVTINGRLVGTSPMRVPDLAPGSHAIRLDLPGHKRVTTTVVVRAGQVVPVRVSLELM